MTSQPAPRIIFHGSPAERFKIHSRSPLTSILSCSGTLLSQKQNDVANLYTDDPCREGTEAESYSGRIPGLEAESIKKSPASALPLHTHSPTHAGTGSHRRSEHPWGFPRPPPGCCLSLADQNTQSPAPRENQSRVRQGLEREGRLREGPPLRGKEEKQEW